MRILIAIVNTQLVQCKQPELVGCRLRCPIEGVPVAGGEGERAGGGINQSSARGHRRSELHLGIGILGELPWRLLDDEFVRGGEHAPDGFEAFGEFEGVEGFDCLRYGGGGGLAGAVVLRHAHPELHVHRPAGGRSLERGA